MEIDQNGKPLEEEEPHPVLCYSHRPYQPAPLHLLLRTITRGRLKTLFVVYGLMYFFIIIAYVLKEKNE